MNFFCKVLRNIKGFIFIIPAANIEKLLYLGLLSGSKTYYINLWQAWGSVDKEQEESVLTLGNSLGDCSSTQGKHKEAEKKFHFGGSQGL